MRVLIATSVLALSLLGGCSRPQYILSEGTGPAVEPTAQGPVYGALANADPRGHANGLNSDNKPIITRSGINSDPNNPSGMPSRPVHWYEI